MTLGIGMTKCDVCGDESNSAPGLVCGRDFGEELDIAEGKVICPGIYRAEARDLASMDCSGAAGAPPWANVSGSNET